MASRRSREPRTTAPSASATWRKPPAFRRRRSAARSPFRTACAPKRASACSRRCGGSATRPTKRRGRCGPAQAGWSSWSSRIAIAAPFSPDIINSIDAELSAEGYTMIVGSLDGIEEKARRLVDLVYARQIDGVIVLTGRLPVIDGRSLRDAGVPIVSICCEMDMPRLPTVLINDEECAIAQTRHLIDLGHRNLLYVSGPGGHYNEIVRYRGYLKAATAFQRQNASLCAGAYTFESGAAAARYFWPGSAADRRRLLQRRNGDRLHQDGDGRGGRRSRRGFRRRFRRHRICRLLRTDLDDDPSTAPRTRRRRRTGAAGFAARRASRRRRTRSSFRANS